MALKSLKRRRLRTAFTVSGIVIGVALILVLLSLTAGTSTRANGLINTLSPAQITVVNATGRTPGGPGGGQFFVRQAAPGAGAAGFPAGGGAPPAGATFFSSAFGSSSTLEQSVVGAVANLTGVAVASPTLSSAGYVNGTAAFLTGVDPSTYASATGGLNIDGPGRPEQHRRDKLHRGGDLLDGQQLHREVRLHTHRLRADPHEQDRAGL
jgi:ABC-type antimicrobial peptide transport system permease subunit